MLTLACFKKVGWALYGRVGAGAASEFLPRARAASK
jgi:hypothetical protein